MGKGFNTLQTINDAYGEELFIMDAENNVVYKTTGQIIHDASRQLLTDYALFV